MKKLRNILVALVLLISMNVMSQEPLSFYFSKVERTDINTKQKDVAYSPFNIDIDTSIDMMSISSPTDYLQFQIQPYTQRTDEKGRVLFNIYNTGTGNTNVMIVDDDIFYLLEDNYLFRFGN